MTTDVLDAADIKKRGNAMIGEKVHTLMWREGRKQNELANVLRVDQGSVSKRLRGKTDWTAIDLIATAHWLDVPVEDLLPEVVPPDDDDPSAVVAEGPGGAPTRARTWDLRIKSP